MAAPHTIPAPAALADAIAQRVLDHPAVAHLHGGPFGTVASYLPGRRVVGVRVNETDGSVDLSVVLWVGVPLRQAVADLRRVVGEVAGPVVVNVTVADLHSTEDDVSEPPGDRAAPGGEPVPG
jgi:hypothetical protein